MSLPQPTFVLPTPPSFASTALPHTIPSPTTPSSPTPRRVPRCTAKDDQRPRRRRPPRKTSAFENTLDDLTMKRLGRGTIYYGTRASPDSSETDPDDILLKPDPVLVAGGTGRTGQWIALGLMNQRFNVRCLTRSFAKAEKLFGPSGSNLDVFEGDVANLEEVMDAVDGAVAVVAACGAPWWLPGGFDAVDVAGVWNLVAAAKEVGTVKRFVLLSALDVRSPRGRAKRRAEEIVVESGLPYVILRAGELTDGEGGLRKISLTVGDGEMGRGELSRIDLAQSVCQALVYDRSISLLKEEDPEGDFDFPSCVVSVRNGEDPYVPDKRFWKREFNRISDAYRDKTDIDYSVSAV